MLKPCSDMPGIEKTQQSEFYEVHNCETVSGDTRLRIPGTGYIREDFFIDAVNGCRVLSCMVWIVRIGSIAGLIILVIALIFLPLEQIPRINKPELISVIIGLSVTYALGLSISIIMKFIKGPERLRV